jgi:hypothetical protein
VIDITGVALDYRTNEWSPFSMSFDFTGGVYSQAGCDSWLMNGTVSQFSLTLSSGRIADPTQFSANYTRTPFPCGSTVYAGLWSDHFYLQSTGELFSTGSTLNGSFGTWGFRDAQFTVQTTPDPPVSTPEPSLFALIASAYVAMLIVFVIRYWPRR